VNILITGKHGYIAGHLKSALSAEGCQCDAISLRTGLPGLSGYDTVIHCAALVHTKGNDQKSFFDVNAGLTAALAAESKKQGARRFIFMSTMAVYGVSGRLRGPAVIGRQTPENPVTPYGKSKLKAENILRGMADERFHIYILRLPMVYGEGAPGNYARLCRLVELTPVFPKVDNERSMISIVNLQNYMLSLLKDVERRETGGAEYTHILWPQDPKPVCTADLAKSIAASQGKKLILSPFLGRLVMLFPIEPVYKMFGNLTYTGEHYGL